MPYRYRPKALSSTFPSNPVDGQEIFYQASGAMAASGVIWQMRYNASSSSAYKWEFVGGSPLVSSYLPDEAFGGFGNQAWGSINSANDPTLITPIAGIYIVSTQATVRPQGAAASVFIGLRTITNGGSGTTTDPSADVNTAGGYGAVAGARQSLALTYTSTISANLLLRQVYWHNQGSSATITRSGASLTLTPVRF